MCDEIAAWCTAARARRTALRIAVHDNPQAPRADLLGLLDGTDYTSAGPGLLGLYQRGVTVELPAGEPVTAGQGVEEHAGCVRPVAAGARVAGLAVTSAAAGELVRVISTGAARGPHPGMVIVDDPPRRVDAFSDDALREHDLAVDGWRWTSSGRRSGTSHRRPETRGLPVGDRWPALAGLPVCPVRLLPVPWVAGWHPDGSAAFTVNDTRRRAACGRHRLCGICGGALDNPMWFLGQWRYGADPARLVFTDPGMHEAHALASMDACPYIARPRVPRRPPPCEVNSPDVPAPDGKPGWVLLTAGGYQMIDQPRRGGGVVQVFKPGPLIAVRYFAYAGPGGALLELARTTGGLR